MDREAYLLRQPMTPITAMAMPLFRSMRLRPFSTATRRVGAEGLTLLVDNDTESTRARCWRIRYVLFGMVTLVAVSAVAVLFALLVYIPHVPNKFSPPPPSAPIGADGNFHVDAVRFSIVLMGPAQLGRRRLAALYNAYHNAYSALDAQNAIHQQMPAAVRLEHITVEYNAPVVTGSVLIAEGVSKQAVLAVFLAAGFKRGYEADTAFEIEHWEAEAYKVQWTAPSPPPSPPAPPPSAPPLPGLPPSPPPSSPPPPHTPMVCPATVPTSGDFCTTSGFTCGYDERCCAGQPCACLTTAWCTGDRAWSILLTNEPCAPTAPPLPPLEPWPPPSPPPPPPPPPTSALNSVVTPSPPGT